MKLWAAVVLALMVDMVGVLLSAWPGGAPQPIRPHLAAGARGARHTGSADRTRSGSAASCSAAGRPAASSTPPQATLPPAPPRQTYAQPLSRRPAMRVPARTTTQ